MSDIRGRRRVSESQDSDASLPAHLKPLFWEYDVSQLCWETDRDLIIGRILATGGWNSIKWLVKRLGRQGLRQWIEERRGRGLDPQQLRFWELILGLPHRTVNHWIEAGDPAWAGRRRR